MKKLLLLLLCLPLLVACGDSGEEEVQDYTSFVVENKYIENETFYYLKVAHKNDKGEWVKISDLGHLSKNERTQEVKLTQYYSEIRLFCNFYADTDVNHYYSFEIKENVKNILTLEEATQWQVVQDPSDPIQYPQE